MFRVFMCVCVPSICCPELVKRFERKKALKLSHGKKESLVKCFGFMAQPIVNCLDKDVNFVSPRSTFGRTSLRRS
jgi:hypothetical protein